MSQPDRVAARLSFEVLPIAEEPGAAEIALYLDKKGLQTLRAALDQLSSGDLDQVHLLSPSWGGDLLTEERWRSEGLMTHHLKIYVRSAQEPLRVVRFIGT